MSDFSNAAELLEGLTLEGYVSDHSTAAVTFLAERLSKPLLIEGPAGTGKTELAKSFARLTGRRLIRLQCYEGLDESKILYEWNYKKQLLRIQTHAVAESADQDGWKEVEQDIFSDEFLLTRPLLESLRSPEPVVLLIDEVDRVELETEAMLLEVLSEFQVSIPELGTISAVQKPIVFLTSNDTRDLSEALKRRCLYLHLDYPSAEREQAIIQSRVPDLPEHTARRISDFVSLLRGMDLRKHPSISESLDWAHALLLLGVSEPARADFDESLNVLLKFQSDIDLVRKSIDGVLS